MNIFVFGNLGSGKSTLADNLEKLLPNILVVKEKFTQNPFLKRANEDIRRWALSLQLKFLVDYIDSYRKTVPQDNKKAVIIDAGVWTNWYVFVENLKNKELISKEEYQLYAQTSKTLVDLVSYPEPDIILYVNTLPKKCHERLKTRGWNFQKRMSINYLIELHYRMLQMIKDYKSKGIEIVEVDNIETDVRDLNDVKSVANRIKAIIK